MKKRQKPRVEKDALFEGVRDLIVSARQAVVKNVNTMQVVTNFEIGKRIVKYEQKGKIRAAYGKALLKKLSEKLNAEFGRGFSARNLRNMRLFYVTYQKRVPSIWQTPSAKLVPIQKSQTVFGKSQKRQILSAKTPASIFSLSWSQYVFLLGVKDEEERGFYEIEAARNNWTLPELVRQSNAGLYERLALSRNKTGIKELAKKGQIVQKPEDLLKEPYVLEFLGLDENTKYSEADMETAVIDKLEQFLLELGRGFLFEARQRRFTFGEDHCYVDLVFYNRLLRCYVLIDLKIGKLTHQDLGQMQMYVNYFDRKVKKEGENSTVGIILCRKKHDALVEITLPQNTNIHAQEYRLYLPSKTELRKKLLEWTG